MKRIRLLMVDAVFLLLTGCSSACLPAVCGGMVKSYTEISQEEAREVIEKF